MLSFKILENLRSPLKVMIESPEEDRFIDELKPKDLMELAWQISCGMVMSLSLQSHNHVFL